MEYFTIDMQAKLFTIMLIVNNKCYIEPATYYQGYYLFNTWITIVMIYNYMVTHNYLYCLPNYFFCLIATVQYGILYNSYVNRTIHNHVDSKIINVILNQQLTIKVIIYLTHE